jgi:lipoyl(octanoyl) transferase
VISLLAHEKTLTVNDLGLIDYQNAWQLQKKTHEKVVSGEIKNTLLLLEHTSVYTAGRRTEISDRPIDATQLSM